MKSTLWKRICTTAKSDEGAIAVVQMAALAGVAITLLFAVIQAELWYHAKTVALSAAQLGARAGSGASASQKDGNDAANAFIASNGNAITGAQVTTIRTRTDVTVTVTGTGTVFPGLPSFPITQTATYPVERFTTAGDTR